MSWASLHNHTFYSLHDAIAKPGKLAERAAELGYPAMAMTDHGNLGCAVDFSVVMKKAGIKPILGCEFSICEQDAAIRDGDNGPPYGHAIVLAKDLQGWRQLIAAVSRSASREYAHHGPRIHRGAFADFAAGGHLVVLTGHMGSDLANALFATPKVAYSREGTPDDVRSLVDRQGWRKRTREVIEQYISIFGKGNVFLEAQVNSTPASRLVADAVRYLSGAFDLPVAATADVHYVRPDDHRDQRVILSSMMKTSLKKAPGRANTWKDLTIQTFFAGGSRYHLPAIDELRSRHTPEEIANTLRVSDLCESYDITRQPMLPRFECPDGMTPETYLRDLCERGWRDKVQPREAGLSHPIQVYRDRLEMELGVINGAGLPSYFLIVQDFLNYGRARNWILGPGRGSGAGCIVSWLTGITGIDPVRYGLIFERFYNSGRNAPGRVSLPDIDSDFPKEKVGEVYEYLQRKYGEDRVAKIATFNSMQGRSALTEVMSAHGVPFDVIKRITKILPDKARISEELEEMRQRGEEPSIIGYSLDVLRDDLAEWVVEHEDGSLTGEYQEHFAQARRLEGVRTHISKHAAGVAIGAEPLAGLCPLKYDASAGANIAAMEWTSLEAVGVPKFDVLVTVFLDKAHGVRSQLRRGRIHDDTVGKNTVA